MIESVGASLSRLAEVRTTLEAVRAGLAVGAGEPDVDGADARLGRMAAEVARVEKIMAGPAVTRP